MGRYDFEPERILELNGPKNLRGKKLYYETINGIWWIEADSTNTSVKIWRERYGIVGKIHYLVGNYTNPEYHYINKFAGDCPTYVITIAKKLTTILKQRHP